MSAVYPVGISVFLVLWLLAPSEAELALATEPARRAR
jgi:hypothetical protein